MYKWLSYGIPTIPQNLMSRFEQHGMIYSHYGRICCWIFLVHKEEGESKKIIEKISDHWLEIAFVRPHGFTTHSSIVGEL